MKGKDIKTYKHIQENHEKVFFKIKRMSDIYKERLGAVDEAHRHDYYTVLLVNDAQGIHRIDFKDYELSKDQIFCVSPGQVHQVLEERPSMGYILLFSNDFLIENNISLKFIEDLNLFRTFGDTPPIVMDTKEMMRVNSLCELLLDYDKRDMKFKTEAISSYLRLILIECNNACTSPFFDNPQSIEAGNSVLKNFKDLINENYKQIHSVSGYAEILHISADHLNRTIKNLTGKTAKDHLDGRIILAAKRLLYFSSLSTKEIAFDLGFNEPAHFSTYFKKLTGESPSKYRKNKQIN